VQPHDMSKAGKALEAELIVFCRKHLSPIKVPEEHRFEAELPRTQTGKLVKRHCGTSTGRTGGKRHSAEWWGRCACPPYEMLQLISSCPGVSRASTSLQSRFTKRRGWPGSVVKTRFALLPGHEKENVMTTLPESRSPPPSAPDMSQHQRPAHARAPKPASRQGRPACCCCTVFPNSPIPGAR